MANTHTSVTVQLPLDRVLRLRELAEKAGVSTHRYVQKVLVDYASREYPEEKHIHVLPSERNAEPLTETINVQIPLDVAQRLHRAARLLRTPAGDAATPAWLARQLIAHFCFERSDIMERLDSIERDYIDLVPFRGRTLLRGGITWYQLPVKLTMQQRDAVAAAARDKSMSMSALVRRVFDRALPHQPSVL